MGQTRSGTHRLLRAETVMAKSAGIQCETNKARHSQAGESTYRGDGVSRHPMWDKQNWALS